jgi:hypothetical protein
MRRVHRSFRGFIEKGWDSKNLDRPFSGPAVSSQAIPLLEPEKKHLFPRPLRKITLRRRTMGLEKPMREVAAVSGMSPVQSVRYVPGPYPLPLPHFPRNTLKKNKLSIIFANKKRRLDSKGGLGFNLHYSGYRSN